MKKKNMEKDEKKDLEEGLGDSYPEEVTFPRRTVEQIKQVLKISMTLKSI